VGCDASACGSVSSRRGWGPAASAKMTVGLLTVELHVPGSQSLKDKRMVLRRIKDRLKKFNVAVSEVEHHDLWQRAALAVVTVSTDEKHADRELAAVADEIERVEPGLITRTDVEFLT
jgi:uncharacterized protein YlxP (DUF503 family)